MGGGDQRTLVQGRSLFVGRCIQCHALPEIQKYDAERWREIVRTMSARANLSANDREALLKYLLAARTL